MVIRIRRWARAMNRRFPGSGRTTMRMFRRTPRARTRYRLRRFVRRPMRTELKWLITASTSNQDVGPGLHITQPISATAIPQGPGINERVGNQCKLTRVGLHLVVLNNSPTTAPITAPTVQSSICRVIIWSPRIEVARVLNYFNAVPIRVITQLDFNVMTVHKDQLVYLSPPYMAEATTNDIAGGPFALGKQYRWSFFFPRSVKFSNVAGDSADVDDDKDVMYCTVVAGNLDVRWTFEAKTWFKDA